MVPAHLGKQNSLFFPCVFSVFPSIFVIKWQHFKHQNWSHRHHATIFSACTFLISTFYLKIFKFLCFPCVFQNFQIPCVYTVWNYFSPLFHVEWEPWECWNIFCQIIWSLMATTHTMQLVFKGGFPIDCKSCQDCDLDIFSDLAHLHEIFKG